MPLLDSAWSCFICWMRWGSVVITSRASALIASCKSLHCGGVTGLVRIRSLDTVLCFDDALLLRPSVFGGAAPDSIEKGVWVPGGAVCSLVLVGQSLLIRPGGVRSG